MPLRSRFNVKRRIEARIERCGAAWLPDVAQSIGVEAAAGAASAAPARFSVFFFFSFPRLF